MMCSGQYLLFYSDLEDGVQKDMTLDLNTEGQVMFTIKLEMNDKKQIPISPTLKKQRLEAEKATQGINEGSKTGMFNSLQPSNLYLFL